MSDLAWLTISEAATLLRTRRLSPVEWTKALLQRIASLDSDYNAFIAVTAERALAEARQAEAEIARGEYRGPLHGVPLAVKDIFDVAGMATTCHSKLRAGHRATRDATAIRKLRDAGAILVGKLSLHEFANGGPTFDLPWPPARNPWNRQHHPGGSSSGSGTAVAAGFVPAALGTDTGGSVRNPATCCGIVGMKPTYGLVSRAGVFPLAFSLDHVGPLTRTVEDNAIVLQALAGFDATDPTSADRPALDCTAALRQGVRGLRIGVIEHFYKEDAAGEAELVAAMDAGLEVLRGLGAQLRTIRLSPLSRWGDCGRTILQSEAYAVHQRDFQERPQDYAPITLSKILPGAFIPASEYVKAQQWRRVLAGEFAAAMQDLDAVVTVSNLDPPCEIDDVEAIARTYERQCRMPFNVTGTPAISVPTGFNQAGIPLGMQVGAKAFDEATAYRVAFAFCEATGLTERHPVLEQARAVA